jgi:chorismate-pyruvate lyase
VLSREQHESSYLREVVLKSAHDGRPVEYGVIRICLDHLPAPASRRVLEEQRPLGNILQTEAIPHLSWPQAFFSIQPDSHLNRLLGLARRDRLYGRRNVLLDGSRRLLAEVIEILAPAP